MMPYPRLKVIGGGNDSRHKQTRMTVEIPGEEAGDGVEIAELPGADVGTSARAGDGDDFGQTVAIDIFGGDAHAPLECGIVSEEAGQKGLVESTEGFDMRGAVGSGDDVGFAI